MRGVQIAQPPSVPHMNVRQGPRTNHGIAGVAEAGEAFDITEKNALAALVLVLLLNDANNGLPDENQEQ